MSCHEYHFQFYDPSYSTMLFERDDIVFADFGRSVNEVGAAQIRLCGCDLDFDPTCNLIMEIWHKTPCGNTTLDGQTAWFLREWEWSWEGPTKCLDLFFYDSLWLLNQRIVAWYATENPQSPSHMQGDLGEMLVRLARGNFGDWVCSDTADPLVTVPSGGVPKAAGGPGSGFAFDCNQRKMPIAIFGPVQSGTIGTHEFAWRNYLLDAMKEVADDSAAQGVPLYFDVVVDPVTKEFSFRTWKDQRGQDRSGEVVFSPSNENVAAFRERVVCPTASHVYVGGGDGGTGQRIIQGVANYPAGLMPIVGLSEVYIDGGDTVDEATLSALGRAELWRQSGSVTHTGTVVDADGSIWGCDYNYGDKVGAKGNFYSEAVISSYRTTLSGGVAQTDIPLESTAGGITTTTSGV